MGWDPRAKTGESGLADDYVLVTGTDNRFGFPYENAPEVCALILTGDRIIDGEEDEGHLWLSCGDFEPGDKEGSFALHSSQNEDKHFNSNSKVMRAIKSALEAGVPFESLQNPSRAQYQEKDARMWDNLALRIHEEPTEPVQLRDGSMSKPGRQPLVVEYLGTREKFFGGGEARAAASVSASASVEAAVNNGSGDVTDEQVALLAKQSANPLAFLEKGVELGLDPSDPRLTQEAYTAARA